MATRTVKAYVQLGKPIFTIMNGTWKKDKPVYTSRIKTTRLLVESMKKNPPKAFVQASAVGIYETNTKETLDENSPPFNIF